MDDLTRLPGEAPSAGTLTSSGAEWGASRRVPSSPAASASSRLLGRGGMGEVYRADDLKLGQTVALKFLPDNVARDPARLAQLPQRGAHRADRSRIATSAASYDIGEADGRPFLTMEYVDGEDLASLLRRIGRFPQDKALEVARQLCAGLAAAHERGVLHRDLKPANVMIDGDGQRPHHRLRARGGRPTRRGRSELAGTPAYMAPEQLAGQDVDRTRATSTRSAGAVRAVHRASARSRRTTLRSSCGCTRATPSRAPSSHRAAISTRRSSA